MIALLVEPNMADCGFARVVLFIGFLCLLLVVCAQGSQERNISIVEYSCDQSPHSKLCNGKNYSIVHVVAESIHNKNAIHYLWSVVYSPTIIVAYFETTGVHITVDWAKILNGSATPGGISFSVPSKYITALVIPAFYEFQDPKDELFYTKGKYINSIVKHPFNSVDWNKPDIDHKNNITTFTASVLGGNVTFQCNASFDQGRESILPKQQFSSNSTVFTLNLNHLTGLNKTKHTRFIFELHSFTVDKTELSTTCVKADKSIDDEFTPAVFKTIVVNNTGSGQMSYSAWKPVAYVDKKRSLDNQVPSWAYYKNSHHFISQECQPLPPNSFPRPLFSIAYTLKGTHFLSYGINISFGQQKDGWYDGSKESTLFLSWSAAVGYGNPLTDKLSTVVLIIIIVGFGAPLLLIVITVVYIIAKKLKAKKATSSYGMIN